MMVFCLIKTDSSLATSIQSVMGDFKYEDLSGGTYSTCYVRLTCLGQVAHFYHGMLYGYDYMRGAQAICKSR